MSEPPIWLPTAECILGGRLVVEPLSLALPRGPSRRWSDRTAPARPRCCGRWRPPARAGTVRSTATRWRIFQLRERARRFAYLPQGHVVHWPLPVRDVVALGRFPHGATDPSRLPPHDAAAVERAMRATDIDGFRRSPGDRIVGRRAQPRAAGTRARGRGPGHFGGRADRLARPAPSDRGDALPARRRRGGTLVIVVTHDLGARGAFRRYRDRDAGGRLAPAVRPPQTLSPDDARRGVRRRRVPSCERKGEPVIVPWTTA